MISIPWFNLAGPTEKKLAPSFIRRTTVLLIIAATATTASAAVIGSRSLEVGGGIGELDDSGPETDLVSYFGRWNQPTGKFLVFSSDVRLEYAETRDDNGPREVKWRDSDLDLLLSLKVLFLKPYALVGASYDRLDFNSTTVGSNDWKWGYNVGAGMEIGILLVTLTPAARYSKAGSTEMMKYSLDASLWFTAFGVGATVSYFDVRNSDMEVLQGVLYAGFRF